MTTGAQAHGPTKANKARLDNRWGSLLSSMLLSGLNINLAIDAQPRPSGASAEALAHIRTRMELLTTRDGKEVWLHQIERPFVFEPPFPDRRYIAIVFSNDETVTDAEQQAVTRSLFASGCRYGVFAGHACGAWETALDSACIESDPNYQPSDEAFTMTTSHEGESVEDVMFFGLMNTSFGSYDFDRFLILFVGSRAGLRAEVQAAIQSVWYENHVG